MCKIIKAFVIFFLMDYPSVILPMNSLSENIANIIEGYSIRKHSHTIIDRISIENCSTLYQQIICRKQKPSLATNYSLEFSDGVYLSVITDGVSTKVVFLKPNFLIIFARQKYIFTDRFWTLPIEKIHRKSMFCL